MVAVYNNKELLSWYLITLKLKETVQANLPPPSPSGNPLIPSYDPPPPPSTVADGVDLPLIPAAENEWIISIRDKLNEARRHEESSPWAKLSIYRVPRSLLLRHDGQDDQAYVPHLVSIGPYHRGQKRLGDMEPHKWRALHHVLRRTGHSIHHYLNAIRAAEDTARACYEGNVDGLSSDEFVEAMVLDGTFVLELFRGVAGEGFKDLGYSSSDPIFALRGTMHSIQRDLILLENQLPLFVLDLLFALQTNLPDRHAHGLVSQLAIRFFDPLMPTDEPLLRKKARKNAELSAPAFDPLAEGTGVHCLDLFRRSLLRGGGGDGGSKPAPRHWLRRRSSMQRCVDKRRQQLVHCVTELREAGIRFRRRKTDRLWDIEFKDGVLWIPRLLIHDVTKSLFLNLIAFEQCHLEAGNGFTSYVIFMDNLINSGEDVGYLHYQGIVEHWLGNDEEVAELFNKLCEEVVFDMNDSYLSGLSERVNEYYNNIWNSWRASLSHRYFSNPWAALSVVAAVVLLLLTMAQTLYSVYGYYRPPS